MTLHRFALRYERFCRLVCRLVIIHVLAVAYTLAGFIIVGIFPTMEAIIRLQRRERMQEGPLPLRQLPTVLWAEWRRCAVGANLRGWLIGGIGLILAWEYRVMNVLGVGAAGYLCAGLLLVLMVFLYLTWVNAAFLNAHLVLPPSRLALMSGSMVIARPLVSLLSVIVSLGWVALVYALPALLIVLGATPVLYCLSYVCWTFGKVPGTRAQSLEIKEDTCGSPYAISPMR